MNCCKDCKYYDDIDGEIGDCLKNAGNDEYLGLYVEKMDKACEKFRSAEND